MVSNQYSIIDSSEIKAKRIACLTLDLEQDYGDLLDYPSYKGLEHIKEVVTLFKEENIPLTCFVQGSILEQYPNTLVDLSQLDIEFELHSYSHPKEIHSNARYEIEKGKDVYCKLFGENPIGFRFPNGVIWKHGYQILSQNGFKYDSSIFPSWRPGSFNNLRKPTKPFILENYDIVEIPFTVFSDFLRIPISMSYIKLLGRPYLHLIKSSNLPNLVILDFHLHDLFDLNSIYQKSLNNQSLLYKFVFNRVYLNTKEGLSMLKTLIQILRNKGYTFKKVIDVFDVINK